MYKKELTQQFIDGELHADDLISLVVEQSKEINRLSDIIKQNNLSLHPCCECGKEERNPGLNVCGECYHKQITDEH